MLLVGSILMLKSGFLGKEDQGGSMNRTMKMDVHEGGVLYASLKEYAKQQDEATLAGGEEASWHQERARTAHKLYLLMSQLNHAGECGHWELSWVKD